jgi:Domain of unknown function DUF29
MSNYDTDFYAWTQAQAAALRAKESKTLDWVNLAEEIESLGRSERFAIERYLQNLLTHLLKWRYDPAIEPRRGWRITIRNARLDIAKRAVGSLGNDPAQYLASAYRYAREDAADATALPLRTFPPSCPWSVEEVLDQGFWPDEPTQAVESTPRGRPRTGPGSIGPRSR